MNTPFDRIVDEFDSFYFPEGGNNMDHDEQANQVLDILCKHVSNPEDVYNLVKDLYLNTDTDRRFCDIIEDVWELIK